MVRRVDKAARFAPKFRAGDPWQPQARAMTEVRVEAMTTLVLAKSVRKTER